MPNSGSMACPVDGATLVMSDRQGVEIDYCPACRGVWLDRGELDKIIERTASYQRPPGRVDDDDDDERPREYGRSEHEHGREYTKRKKKKSFLEDIFDFG